MKQVHVDFETRSKCIIKATGAYRYSLDPSTKVLCISWSYDGVKVYTWCAFEPRRNIRALQNLFDFVRRGGIFVAHNVEFELAIWNNVFCKQVASL